MIIAVDFDGTIVEHCYPEIGEELAFATETIKALINDGHRVILWTVREGELLTEALDWCKERGVEFYAVNRDYPEEQKRDKGYSRKVKADLFIDDRGFGGIPDWGTIYSRIKKDKALKPYTVNYSETLPKKLSWKERITGIRKQPKHRRP